MADASDDDVGVTVASKVQFSDLCGMLEKISKTQGNDKKKRVLKDFVDHWRQSHNSLHGENKNTVMKILLQ